MALASDFIRAEQRARKIKNKIYRWEITPLTEALPADEVLITLFDQRFVEDLQPSEMVNLAFRCQPLYQKLDKMIARNQHLWDRHVTAQLADLIISNQRDRAKILRSYQQITPDNEQTPTLLREIMMEHSLYLPPKMLDALVKQVPALTTDVTAYRRVLGFGNPLLRVPEKTANAATEPAREI